MRIRWKLEISSFKQRATNACPTLMLLGEGERGAVWMRFTPSNCNIILQTWAGRSHGSANEHLILK